MKIAVASPKGGAGKTTLTACLGLSLLEAGKRLDVWDFDPQAGLSNWFKRLEEEPPSSIPDRCVYSYDEVLKNSKNRELYEMLAGVKTDRGRFWRLCTEYMGRGEDGTDPPYFRPEELSGGWKELTEVEFRGSKIKAIRGSVPSDIILGDFPPCDPETLVGMLKGWDRVLIPCQPSPVDVQAVMALVAVLKRDSRPLLVWNGLDGSSYSRPESLKALGAEVGCPIAKATIPRRVGFRNAQLKGYLGLDEVSKSAILSLALEVAS